MKILMISLDPSLVDTRHKMGDTRERHIKYALALQHKYAHGRIAIITWVPGCKSNLPISLTDGLIVYPVSCRREAFPLCALSVGNELMRKERFDLITTQTPFDDGFVGMLLKRRFGVPLNVQMRSSFLDMQYWIKERLVYRVFNIIGKRISKSADTIRVISKGEKARLEGRFPWLAGKVFFLHPLVNLEVFQKPVTAKEAGQVVTMRGCRGNCSNNMVFYAGRLVKTKNLPTLFEGFQLVTRVLDAILVIAGDGPLRKDLMNLAERLDISRHIVWLGNLSLHELRSYYSTSACSALLSFYEGFGKVVVESYLMGTPVVATPFVSAPELIRDGETGFIIRGFHNARAVAEKLIWLLTNPMKSQEMGRLGKEYLLDHYLLSEEEYMEQLVSIWERTACAG